MAVEPVNGVQVGEQVVVAIEDEADLIHVRQVLRTQAEVAGLGLVDSTKLVTAGSELTRNVLTYATGARGQMLSRQLESGGLRGVQATFTDEGPGIDDLDAALADGFSTSGNLGLGLPGSRRLVDQMTIDTGASGTAITVIKWARADHGW
jgi:serine/threonine-protein kinase RsbT